MSIGSFIFGATLMIVGFFAVWRTDWFVRNMGDISELFNAVGMPWLSWKLAGVILLTIGFLTAFGLLSIFLGATIGRLFTIGGI